jgi:FkbM family methyltransferase
MINKLLQHFGLTIRRHYPIVPLLKRRGVKTVLDVGSSVGQFKDKLREEGWRGMVHSFEANPHRIGQCRVEPLWKLWNVALSDSERDAVFHVNSCADASSLESSPGTVYRMHVRTQRLDSIMLKSDGPYFLKVDAEGHDIRVVAGAIGILDVCPVVQIETSPERIAADILYLNAHGYRVERISEFPSNIGFAFDLIATRAP